MVRLQVGGHTRMLLLDQDTICKPLNPRELDFYQNIPQDIQNFVPKYKGIYHTFEPLPLVSEAYICSFRLT